jgi:DprA/Smf-like nucleotide binding protein involved in DNA uptake/HNH endonuclease
VHGDSSVTPHEASSASATQSRYCSQLDTRDLVAEIRRLLTSQRRAERLICRYLADLADRVRDRRDPELAAYVDEFHAARCFFQLGVRETRERVRVGRALRQLPEIEQAFVDGALSYSRVREVTRVATAASEGDWLSLATRLDMRTLERRVAGAAKRADDNATTAGDISASAASSAGGSDLRVQWTTPQSVRVTLELSADAWALLERAIDGARHLAADTLTDGEALEAVARDALSQQNDQPDASDPRTSVVVYTCKECGTSEADTGSGAVELDARRAAATCCGASVIDLEREGRSVTVGGPLPSAIRRAVMLRDRCRCRVPGCGRRRYVDVHHITSQADGGAHSRANCVVLCTTHHRLLHEGKLRISGDADGEIEVRDSTEAPIGDRHDANQSATQGGSSPEATLLRVMGRRGGWSTDELVESSGLSASIVSRTLLLLELDGKVTNDDFVFARA